VTTPRPVTAVRALKVRPGRHVELPDDLATEEPMEIRVAGPGQAAEPVVVTMRTPGHDFDLAAGFLVTEGLVQPAEITGVRYCESVADPEPDSRFNIVTVSLDRRWTSPGPPRAFTASTSCGLCGKSSIDQVEVACPPVPPAAPVPAALLPLLPDRLRATQRIFDRTGGLHAAGLFDPTGDLHAAREDVGRHNAVDKVVGHTVLAGGDAADRKELAGSVLVVSGRVSFEIVQKAAMAGIGTIAAVSAPSSLAVTAAERLGLAIVGFLRGDSYNVYSHPERLAFT
jgi:FdhD protein